MLYRFCAVVLSVAALAGTVACSNSNSSSPTSPTTTTVTVGIPAIVSPSNGSQIANSAQPVTLTVQNATSTASGTTYTFEVASDVAFVTKVQTKTAVAEGTGGQTSVRLDALLAGATYFWRAQAVNGSTSGTFSPAAQFTVGAVISLGTPAPVSPLTGTTTPTDRPTFTVTNVTKSGPTGSISYKFEVADNTGFNPTLLSSTVTEGAGGRTTITAGTALPTGKTLFWRVTATDTTNNVSSSASATQSFQASTPSAAGLIAVAQGVTLWPGTQPPGTPGKASMSAGWGIANLRDYLGNPFLNPPLEALQLFDLMDRGLDPDGAIGWLRTNGYSTVAVYYDSVKAIGLPTSYLALIGGSWELVLRVGA